jgi:L-rhamnose-H+ transport protein
MLLTGVLLASLSGLCNGLFTAPMKIIPHWKWENIWLIFILTSCLLMPVVITSATIADIGELFAEAPRPAITAAFAFGFLWGFGAILFGLSVDRLGVSVANSLVIGLSSALGALVPLLLRGGLYAGAQQLLLLAGVAAFIGGVWMCAQAGRLRDAASEPLAEHRASWSGYVFAIGSGVMSAVFNIGYTLALPIADAGERLGNSAFASTSSIWLLMLGAGAVPNICFCLILLRRHGAFGHFRAGAPHRTWGLAVLMGLLWGGSIFLYGAATPRLGRFGPSVGWPLSLAVALVVANMMGILLGEWRTAGPSAIRRFRGAMALLFTAIVLCAASAGMGVQ